ncbi:MAG: hypothetical protein ABUS54_07615 [Actinomycetota bacterium]
MYPPSAFASLYERPALPVVYDTPPLITSRRPLLLRALDVLRRTRGERPAAPADAAALLAEAVEARRAA